MPSTQLARGLWTGYSHTENPFSSSAPGMEDNLRLIDDHLGLYTLSDPVLPGTPLPASPVDGAGQLYAGGAYAVFNGGSWKTYAARKGVIAKSSDGEKIWMNTGTAWVPYGTEFQNYDGGHVFDVLDANRPVASFEALRGYSGRANVLQIADPLRGGKFKVSDDDSDDDDGMTLLDALGRVWQREHLGTVHVEWFGAIGDRSTNDIAAFVAAMRYSQRVGGVQVVYGASGRVYRIAYNAEYPAIVIPSGTIFQRIGGGYLLIDPTLLPSAAPSGGASNWVPAFGEITTGNAQTLMRPGAGYQGGSPLNGFIVDNFDPDTACHDVHVINPKIICEWRGTLLAAQRCYGIRMWFCYDSTITNPVIKGLPHSGLMWAGGSRNVTVGQSVIEQCGIGALPGVSRNGYNALGVMCLNAPEYSTRSHASGPVLVNECQDEGYMFSNCGQIIISSVMGQGNRDRLIEGDSSYATSQTAASLGQEIPNEIIIGQMVFDGLNSDGGRGQLGVSITCGNEGRVVIGQVTLRRTGSVGAVVSVAFSDGGRVNISKVVMEDCHVPANHHAVYVQAKRVYVDDVVCINSSGQTNSAIVAVSGAEVALIGEIDADEGFVHGVRFDGSTPAKKLSVKSSTVRGLTQSFIYLNVAARVDVVDVIDNDVSGLNSAGALDRSFVTVANPAFRCGTLRVRGNRARVAAPTQEPFTISGGVTLPAGAIETAKFIDNDFDDEGLFCDAGTQFPKAFNNYAGQIGKYIDVDNDMPSQRTRQASAVPTTGTWARGDRVVISFPAAGGASEYRCVTPGTFATLTGITATTTAGQSTAVLSDASAVVPGSWISIAGVTSGSDSVFRVVAKTGNVVRFSLAMGQSVSGAAVSNLAPSFKSINLAA